MVSKASPKARSTQLAPQGAFAPYPPTAIPSGHRAQPNPISSTPISMSIRTVRRSPRNCRATTPPRSATSPSTKCAPDVRPVSCRCCRRLWRAATCRSSATRCTNGQMWDGLKVRAPWSRSLRSSPRRGKPVTWRRETGRATFERGRVRDAQEPEPSGCRLSGELLEIETHDSGSEGGGGKRTQPVSRKGLRTPAQAETSPAAYPTSSPVLRGGGDGAPPPYPTALKVFRRRPLAIKLTASSAPASVPGTGTGTSNMSPTVFSRRSKLPSLRCNRYPRNGLQKRPRRSSPRKP